MKIVENYLAEIKNTIDLIPVSQIEEVIALLQDARARQGQIFIMGNGGSASTATHFVCDLSKNTGNGLPAFRVIGLTDNMAVVTAYANDEGYETVFARQLGNLLQPGDIVIAISGSGNSKNILCGVELANQMGAVTVGFTGLTGGALRTLAQKNIHVPNSHIDQVEDIHLMLEHMICRSLKQVRASELEEEAAAAIPAHSAHDNDELVKGLFGKSLPLIRHTGSLGAGNEAGIEVLSRIRSELTSPNDLHELLSRVLFITVEQVDAVGGSIVVLDENGEVVEGALIYGGKIQQPNSSRLIETVHHGLAGWVLENRQPALVENTKEDPRWMPRGWEATLDLSRSAVSVPIIVRDRVCGVLTLTRMQSNRFTMEELSLLTSITLALSYSFSSRSTIITGL